MSVIHSLRANRFRGASQPLRLNFSPAKKVALIFGESGCGKSCIADAIEFALTGKFGSLMEKQGLGRETTIAGYLRSVGTAGGATEAEVTRGTESWKATLAGTAPVLTGSRQRPPFGVLRRARLLSFIEAQPAGRYEGLASFVDVPLCIASEEALREALKTTKKDLQAKTESVTRDESALEAQWKDEGAVGASWQDWAGSLATLDAGTSDAEVAALSAVASKVDGLLSAGESHDAAKRELAAKDQQLKAASERLLGVQAARAEAGLLDILTRTTEFLRSHPEYAQCPVCEKPNDAIKLADALDVRLVSLKSVVDATTAQRKAESAFSSQTAVLERLASSVVWAATEVVVAMKGATSASALMSELGDGLASALGAFEEHGDFDAASALCASVKSPRELIAGRIAELQQSAGKASIVKRLVEQVMRARTAASDLTLIQSRLEAALKVVEDCRKEYVNGILLSVAAEAERMYAHIHTNEPLGAFKLWLVRRSSLMLAGRFESIGEVDPQAYYSESHLDTLGLCIFLALEKRDNARAKLLVLDDVLSSVDQPHLWRTVDLLLAEAQSFGQLILTTHYGNLYTEMRNRQSSSSCVEFFELRPWSLTTGVYPDTRRVAADDLRTALAATPFDGQVVASKTGILLEDMLKYVARCTRVSLPYGDVEPTLGDLLPAVKGLRADFRSACKAAKEELEPSAWDDLSGVLKRIDECDYVRSVLGAHDNRAVGANLARTDVERFANLVLELHARLVCPHCGEMVKNRAGSHWECRCGMFCMSPLEKRRN